MVASWLVVGSRTGDHRPQPVKGVEAIAARISGVKPDPLALHFPTSADGLAGALFIDAVIRSSDGDGGWIQVPLV